MISFNLRHNSEYIGFTNNDVENFSMCLPIFHKMEFKSISYQLSDSRQIDICKTTANNLEYNNPHNTTYSVLYRKLFLVSYCKISSLYLAHMTLTFDLWSSIGVIFRPWSFKILQSMKYEEDPLDTSAVIVETPSFV